MDITLVAAPGGKSADAAGLTYRRFASAKGGAPRGRRAGAKVIRAAACPQTRSMSSRG